MCSRSGCNYLGGSTWGTGDGIDPASNPNEQPPFALTKGTGRANEGHRLRPVWKHRAVAESAVGQLEFSYLEPDGARTTRVKSGKRVLRLSDFGIRLVYPAHRLLNVGFFRNVR